MPFTIENYKAKATSIGFEEYPYAICGGEPTLESFVDFDNADIDLKIYLCKVILCRNFSATGMYDVLSDHTWFIKCFLKNYEADLINTHLTDAIKESIKMILSEEPYSKNIIATSFMFGVLEFHVKHLLGWRPMTLDFFDAAQKEFRRKSIGIALKELLKKDCELSEILNEIDNHNVNRLKETGINKERRWVYPRIADRISIARNTMLHGESYNFADKGKYLTMLYSLFYYSQLKKIPMQ